MYPSHFAILLSMKLLAQCAGLDLTTGVLLRLPPLKGVLDLSKNVRIVYWSVLPVGDSEPPTDSISITVYTIRMRNQKTQMRVINVFCRVSIAVVFQMNLIRARVIDPQMVDGLVGRFGFCSGLRK